MYPLLNCPSPTEQNTRRQNRRLDSCVSKNLCSAGYNNGAIFILQWLEDFQPSDINSLAEFYQIFIITRMLFRLNETFFFLSITPREKKALKEGLSFFLRLSIICNLLCFLFSLLFLTLYLEMYFQKKENLY